MSSFWCFLGFHTIDVLSKNDIRSCSHYCERCGKLFQFKDRRAIILCIKERDFPIDRTGNKELDDKNESELPT